MNILALLLRILLCAAFFIAAARVLMAAGDSALGWVFGTCFLAIGAAAFVSLFRKN